MKPPPKQRAREARCPSLPNAPSLPSRPQHPSSVAKFGFRRSHVLALSLVLASVAQAATYEVAQRHPQASDEAPGTTERPWKTIGRVRGQTMTLSRLASLRARLGEASGLPQS